MENEAFNLYRGVDLLGMVVLKNELCDFPWYGGEFKASPAFDAVEPLFREELRLLEADEMDTWEEVWDQISAPGLELLPVAGGEPVSNLIIHLDGTAARWRY